MTHFSENPEEASVLVVDRQHLLRNALCTDLRTDCSITVYEARTSAEAAAQAQTIQPDVVLLDLGVQNAANAEALYQALEASAHFGILVYSDPDDVQTRIGSLNEGVVGDQAQSSSVRHFILALRRAYREIVSTEPDMAHQLFRTWHYHSLVPLLTDTPKCRQLKVLVLVVRGMSSRSIDPWLGKAEKTAWPLLISRWSKPNRETCSLACHALKANLRHLVRYAEGWMSRSYGALLGRQTGAEQRAV
jgi:DNA-binding NarL/FixJ family response regulator